VPWYRRVAAWLFLPLSIKLPAGAAAVVLVAGLAMLIWEGIPELRREVGPGLMASTSPSIATVEPTPRLPSQSAPATATTSRPSPPPRARAGAPGGILPKAVGPVTPSEPAPPQPPAPEVSTSSERLDIRARAAPSAASTAPPAVRRTLTAVPPSDFAGRLIARDRAAAVVAVSNLASSVGGHERARREDGSETVIEVQLPAARYDDFIRGVEALGAWTSAARPAALSLDPPQIRLTIHVGG
jgi:hypothetical protein